MAKTNFTMSELSKMGMIEVSPGVWKKKINEVKSTIRTPLKRTEVAVNFDRHNFGKLLISFPVDPIGKPRMTQSDKWKKRKVTDRYWEMKDHLNIIATAQGFVMPESDYRIVAYIPMPDGWTKEDKEKMDNTKHQMKPDKDNIEKAILDSLCKDDSYVWDGRITKLWAYKERIDIYKTTYL